MKTCDSCGMQSPDGAATCPACGSPLSANTAAPRVSASSVNPASGVRSYYTEDFLPETAIAELKRCYAGKIQPWDIDQAIAHYIKDQGQAAWEKLCGGSQQMMNLGKELLGRFFPR